MRILHCGGGAVIEAAGSCGLRAKHLRSSWVFEPRGERFRNDRGNVCIHGYAAFLNALLHLRPEAHVFTGATIYRGLADFEARQEEVFERVKAGFGQHETCGCDG
jgi:hypothetical protein